MAGIFHLTFWSQWMHFKYTTPKKSRSKKRVQTYVRTYARTRNKWLIENVVCMHQNLIRLWTNIQIDYVNRMQRVNPLQLTAHFLCIMLNRFCNENKISTFPFICAAVPMFLLLAARQSNIDFFPSYSSE